MRLTRRGRVVVFVIALVGLLALAVVGSQVAVAGEHPGAVRTHIVQVKPGDSLWKVASRAAGNGDVSSMEDQIMKLNGLSSDSVQAGQVLRIPAQKTTYALLRPQCVRQGKTTRGGPVLGEETGSPLDRFRRHPT